MKYLFLVLFLILGSNSIKAADLLETATNISIGSGIVLQGIDTNLTTFLIAKNLGKEANPVFVPFASNPILSPLVKSGIAVGTSALLLHYRDKNKTIVLITSLAINGFYSYVVYHNGQIAKGH